MAVGRLVTLSFPRVRLKPDTTLVKVRLKPDTTFGQGPAKAGHYIRLEPDTAFQLKPDTAF